MRILTRGFHSDSLPSVINFALFIVLSRTESSTFGLLPSYVECLFSKNSINHITTLEFNGHNRKAEQFAAVGNLFQLTDHSTRTGDLIFDRIFIFISSHYLNISVVLFSP